MQFVLRNRFWFLVGIFLILIVSLLFFFGREKQTPSLTEEASEVVDRKYGISKDTEYPDAPHPFQEDPDLEGQAKKLWPAAFRSQKTEEEREKIREEWIEFASRYPRNIYIPRDFRPPMTQEDEKKAKERLDAVSSAESKFALARNLGKYSQPGSVPTRPTNSNVSPDEQKVYFAYKIEELESRIQLVQYAIQQGRMDSSQLPQANRDISVWQMEMQQLKQALSSIP